MKLAVIDGDPTALVRLNVLRLPAPEQRVPLCRNRDGTIGGWGWRSANWVAATMPPRDPRARAWYRWMIGHHVAFGAWRLLADLLDAAMRRRDERDRLIALAGEMYDVYSALLLYSGSCSPELYASVIRRRMSANDPAFSGTWARDYERVQRLVREVKVNRDTRLEKARKLNRLVHATVAKNLVPGGHSLLREAGRAADPVVDTDRDTLDRFFLVERTRVCHAQIVAQMQQRITRIRCDLTVYPLEARYDGEVAEVQETVARKLGWLAVTMGEISRCTAQDTDDFDTYCGRR